LAAVLSRTDHQTLSRVGFYDRDQQLLAHVVVGLGEVRDPELRALAESMLRRIRELSPTYRDLAASTLTRLKARQPSERWWGYPKTSTLLRAWSQWPTRRWASPART
jgi:hypothetical protein